MGSINISFLMCIYHSHIRSLLLLLFFVSLEGGGWGLKEMYYGICASRE